MSAISTYFARDPWFLNAKENMLRTISLFLFLSLAVTANSQSVTHSIGATFDGNGEPLPSGKTIYFAVPFGCTIQSWDMTVDTGAASVDIWKVPNGSLNPTSANSITGGNSPAVSQGQHVHSTNLSGWTTSVSAYDEFGFYIRNASGATQASLVMRCQ